MINLLLLVLALIIPENAHGQGCYSLDVGTNTLNPGAYDPTQLTAVGCRYLCQQMTSNLTVYNYQFAALFQGGVCMCRLSAGTTIDSSNCNVSCSGNAGALCGSPSAVNTNLYTLACIPRINSSVINPTYASSISNLTAQFCCDRELTIPVTGSIAITYNSQVPSDSYQASNVYFQCGPLSYTNKFAPRFPGLTTSFLSMTNLENVTATTGIVTSLSQAPGVFGPLGVTPYLVMNNYSVSTSISSLPYGNISLFRGTSVGGPSSSSYMLASKYTTLGTSSGTQSGVIANDTIYFMSSPFVSKNYSIMDVRLVLQNYTASISGSLYIQVWRPQCASGFFCLSNMSCTNSGQSCTPTSATAPSRLSCGSTTTVYSIAAQVCSNQAITLTNNSLINWPNLYLINEIRVDLSTAQLTNPFTGERFISLLSQTVTTAPGDVIGLYQPITTNVAVATRAGQSISLAASSVTGSFSTRTNSLPVNTYSSSMTIVPSSAVFKSGVPMVSLTLARSVNMTMSFMYTNHSCYANPIGCTTPDFYNMTVTATNNAGSSFGSANVSVFMPISLLSLIQPPFCLSFTTCPLTIPPHVGTLPQYIVNFNDGQGTVSVNSTGGSNITVGHYFTLARNYTINATAYNLMSSQNTTTTGQILDAVQGLQIIPGSFPGGLLATPLNFTITLAQGSAAVITVNFGDNSPIVTIPASASVAPTQLPYLSFFTLTPNVDLIDSPSLIVNLTAGLNNGSAQCAKLCLTSTVFACQLFIYVNVTGSCQLYTGPVRTSPVLSVIWSQTGKMLYSLQNQTCSSNLLITIPVTINATSGTTATAPMNSTGWIATVNDCNQVIMFSFSSFVQLNVLFIGNTATGYITRLTIMYSNDTFAWTYWNNSGSANITGLTSSSTSMGIVFDPPIVTRFLKIQAVDFVGSFPSGRFAFSGCQMQGFTYFLTRSYTAFTTSTVVNITVSANNSLSSTSLTLPYFLDTPIVNLTLTCLKATMFANVNDTVPFNVTGLWGFFIRLTITRQDGVVIANGSYNTYNPFYFYNITFRDPGLWILTVTGENSAGVATYTMPTILSVIMVVSSGCGVPYNDLIIPNSCSGTTCDTSCLSINAVRALCTFKTRSSTITFNSNTTNNCATQAVFSWNITQINETTGVTRDYTSTVASIYATRYSSLTAPSLTGYQLGTISLLPRIFAVGVYRISLTLTITPPALNTTLNSALIHYEVLTSTSSTFIRVTKSDIVSCVNNNSASLGGYYDTMFNYTLDSSCSYDPDKWSDEPQNLTVKWDCYRPCESAPRYESNNKFIPWNNSTNPYSTSCVRPANLANKTTPVSLQGCFMPIGIHVSGPVTYVTMDIWNSTRSPMLANAASNRDYSNYWIYAMENGANGNQTVFRFYSITMFFAQIHNVIATVTSADGRTSQFIVSVQLASKMPPNFATTCGSNCFLSPVQSPLRSKYKVDPTSKFAATAKILNWNPLETYTMKWTICRTPGQSFTYADLATYLTPTPFNETTDFSWTRSSTGNSGLGLSIDTMYPVFPISYCGSLFVIVIRITLEDPTSPLNAYDYIAIDIVCPPSINGLVVVASPADAIALNTTVSITCTGGSTTQLPLLYSVGYSTVQPPAGSEVPESSTAATFGVNSCSWVAKSQRSCSGSSMMPAGDAANNNTVYICISLTDNIGARVYGYYPVLKVKSGSAAAALKLATDTSYATTMAANNPAQFGSFVLALGKTINPTASATSTSTTVAPSTGTGSTVTTSATTGTTGSTASTTTILTTTMPTTTMSPEETKQIASVVSTLLTAVAELPPPASMVDVAQTASLLQTLTQTPSYMSPTATQSTYDLATSLSASFAATAATASPTDVAIAGNLIVSSLKNALTASSSSQTLSSDAPVQAPSDSSTLQRQSEAMTSSLKAVSSVALQMSAPGGQMQFIGGILGVQVMTPDLMSSQSFTASSDSCTKFSFGSYTGLFGNYTPTSIGLTNMVINSTQYLYVANATDMNSTNNIALTDSNNVEYNVSGATGDRLMEIWVDTTLDPATVPQLNVNLTPYTLPKDMDMLIHKVFVKANAALFINVQHYLNWTQVPVQVLINGTYVTQYVTVLQNNGSYNGSNIEFIVYIQKNKRPTDSDFISNCTLPILDPATLICNRTDSNLTDANAEYYYSQLANLTKLNFYDTLTQIPNRCSRFSSSMQNPWTCMIDSSKLNNTEDATYYVGVRAIIWNWTLPFVNGTYMVNQTIENAPTSYDVTLPQRQINKLIAAWQYVELNYTFFAYYSGCYYFDTITQQFSQAGCKIGKCSSPYASQCFCSHLTSFSNMFKLPSISFDVSSVNINALNNSPGVMLFLISLICAYCIVWIWARYADIQAEDKLGVTYLPSNCAQDEYAYEITIWTSHLPGSGTSANVSMILAGDNRETASRWLCAADDSKKPFQTGGIDMFLLTSPEWLGSLSHVRIWHDNTGSHPSWYLLRILVRDLYTNTKYYFILNKWLSAVKGLGSVDHLIPVAGKEELRSVQNVMWTNASSRLLDGHMWVSVGTRPSRSRFTRVQRLTCCLVICLTSILFNLLGYIIQNSSKTELLTTGTDPDPPIIALGPISITAFTLTISVISAGCTIPVNMLIALLFQQRRIKNQTNSPQDPYSRFAKASGAEMRRKAEMEKEIEEQEELEKGACRKCLDSFSRCITACMGKIFPLPWWSHYVAYIIALVTVIVAFFCSAVLAYSNLPQEWQQTAWLSSIVLSLIQSIIIIQPITIFAMILVFTFILRLPQEDENEMSKEIALRRPLVEIPPETEQNNKVNQPAKPPPVVEITNSLNERKKREEKIESQLTGALMYLLFILILFLTGQLFVSSMRFYQFNDVSSQLELQYPYQNQQAVPSVIDVWTYLNLKVLPALYSLNLTAYGLSNTSQSSSTLQYLLNTFEFMPDGSQYLLGARLRQVRVAPSGCVVPDLLSSIVPVCFGEYSAYQSDTADYVPGWTGLQLDPNNTTTPFMYTGASGTFSAFAQNAIGGISGAGYIANLTGSLDTSLALLANLTATNWIDAKTRKVYVEFLAYNPSTNLYTVAYSELDLAPTGIVYRPNYYILTLNRYEGPSGGINLLFQAIVALVLVIFTVMTLSDFCNSSKKLCDDMNLLLDFVISVVFIVLVLVYIIGIISSLYSESLITQSPTQFTNLRLICQLDLASNALFGLLAFLLYVRLLKWLRLHHRVRMIIDAVLEGSLRALALAAQLFIGVIAYTAVFFLIYFSSAGGYSTFGGALINLVATISYAFKFLATQQIASGLGSALFCFYAITLVFTTMRLFVPIFSSAMRTVRVKERAMGIDPDNPITYAIWKVKMFCGCENDEDDEKFEYLAGTVDVDELCKSIMFKVDDFSSQVKFGEANKKESEEAMKIEAKKRTIIIP